MNWILFFKITTVLSACYLVAFFIKKISDKILRKKQFLSTKPLVPTIDTKHSKFDKNKVVGNSKTNRKKFNDTNLDTRMINYEKKKCTKISDENFYMCCLEGFNFKYLIKNISFFDSNLFSKIMLMTSGDLIKKFNCSSIFYYESSIIMIFNKRSYERLLFNGNVGKIQSVLSSFTTSRFTQNLHCELNKYNNDLVTNLRNFVEQFNIVFNSNVIVTKNDGEIVNYIFWKSKIICFQNYAKNILKKKLGHGIYSLEKIMELVKREGIDLSTHPAENKYGILIKKQDRSEIQKGHKPLLFAMTLDIKCTEEIVDFIFRDRFFSRDFDDLKKYNLNLINIEIDQFYKLSYSINENNNDDNNNYDNNDYEDNNNNDNFINEDYIENI
mgnify:CR=1 FL=1|jgi:Uncharacterized conserved protein